jgi:hypothetical protein
MERKIMGIQQLINITYGEENNGKIHQLINITYVEENNGNTAVDKHS